MKGFEKVHPEAPGAVTCMSCMGRGTHRVTVPRRFGPGTVTEHPVCPRCNGSGAVMGDAPLRRCEDCALNLGETIHAAFVCPMFGKPRVGVELRCAVFKAKELRRVA